MAFLDGNGVLYLWQKIVNKFVAKETGKGLSEANFTTEEKTKRLGLDTNANKTVVEDNLASTSATNALSAKQGKELNDKIKAINDNMADLGGGDMLRSVYDTDNDGKVDKAALADRATNADNASFAAAAGNANMLDGKSASYFAQKGDLITAKDIFDYNAFSTGMLDYGVCTNGVIRPILPYTFVPSEDGEEFKLINETGYAAEQISNLLTAGFVQLAFTNTDIVVPSNGKLSLALVAFDREQEEEVNINVEVNTSSPLKANTSYILTIQALDVDLDNFDIPTDSFPGYITGLDPETDATPTEGSSNFLTSGAVYEALEGAGLEASWLANGQLPLGEFRLDEEGQDAGNHRIYPLTKLDGWKDGCYPLEAFIGAPGIIYIPFIVSETIDTTKKKTVRVRFCLNGNNQDRVVTLYIPQAYKKLYPGVYSIYIDTTKGKEDDGTLLTSAINILDCDLIGGNGLVDEEPIENSLNPISSGAVYDVISSLEEGMAEFTQGVVEAMEEVTEIANGKCDTYVFDTKTALEADLAEYVAYITDGTEMAATNQFKDKELKTGDVFIIRQLDVPDYWWDSTKNEKYELETEKVEIAAITNAEIDEILSEATGS